jgi:hypothetical protein
LVAQSSALRALTTTISQTILHSIRGIVLVVMPGGAMDMDKEGCSINRILLVVIAGGVMDMDKGECSINRIPPARHPRFGDSNNYTLE